MDNHTPGSIILIRVKIPSNSEEMRYIEFSIDEINKISKDQFVTKGWTVI